MVEHSSGAVIMTVEQMTAQLVNAYTSLIRTGIAFRKFPSVMLWGPPGVGKSQGVRQIAQRIQENTGKKVAVTDVRLLLFNPVDLRGIPTANADKTLAVWLKPKIFQMDASDDAINIFYYLKPDYNYSNAHCPVFENLTYTDLLGMLNPGDDIIIKDFVTHIKCALGGGNMIFDPAEILLLNNYRAFEEKRAETTRKVKAYQDILIQKVVNELGLVIIDWRKLQPEDKPDFLCEQANYGAGIGSYRLYRASWYKENEHYFYVEIKFEYGCMNQIYFQATLRDDEKGKHNHRVPMFFYKNPDIKIYDQDGRYYVIEQQSLFDDQWDSAEWETKFVEVAVRCLKAYMVRMDQVFTEYQKLLNPLP